ncbi:MAG: hypothetical protein ACJAXZ_004381 [Akkermansiaceae bacterium]
MFIGIATLEESAVDLRMEGFETAFEKFGRARVFGDVDDRETGIAEGFGGAAGGEEFNAIVFVKRLGKIN